MESDLGGAERIRLDVLGPQLDDLGPKGDVQECILILHQLELSKGSDEADAIAGDLQVLRERARNLAQSIGYQGKIWEAHIHDRTEVSEALREISREVMERRAAAEDEEERLRLERRENAWSHGWRRSLRPIFGPKLKAEQRKDG